MDNGPRVSNISGHNGPVRDPCPLSGPDEPVESDSADDGSCCAAMAQAIVDLSAQISALATASTVVVRNVCLADGRSSLAYDIIPAGTTDPAQIMTIYRPYPPEEGECVCTN